MRCCPTSRSGRYISATRGPTGDDWNLDRWPRPNLAFANPIYFLLAITLVTLGAWKGWLNSRETLLAALLIFIPYIMRGDEMCMLSQGRFMAVVFPIYLVMGQVLSRIPSPYAAMVVGLFVFYLAIYSMHVAAGYPLI